VQGSSRLEAAALAPQVLVRRSRRHLLPWPERPDDDRYRVESRGVRVTVLDMSAREGEGFRLGGDTGRFAVEVPAGARVRVRVVPRHVEPGDRLEWGSTATRLGEARSLLRLSADEGEPLGPSVVVPVLLRSRAAWISFERDAEHQAGAPAAANAASSSRF
jgi:hypothetical protein